MTQTEGEQADILAGCRQKTNHIVDELRAALEDRVGNRYDELFGDHTTFLLTGSGGRSEMTEGSDIDGYVVRVRGAVDPEHSAEILRVTKEALEAVQLPPLDREGEFQKMRPASDVIGTLGSSEDDRSDAFTVRMLFLLESQPLLGEPAYGELFDIVSLAYRSTAPQHKGDFLPLFLVNDIIRYWRTVLLNHEDRLRQKKKELEDEGLTAGALEAEVLAHRRYRSQKLRFPRCLSCFSALAYFLALAPGDDDTITAQDERRMFELSPIQRLRAIADERPSAKHRIDRMLDLYSAYLQRSQGDKKKLLARLRDEHEVRATTSNGGLEFTREMYDLVQHLGQGNRLHRQMLI